MACKYVKGGRGREVEENTNALGVCVALSLAIFGCIFVKEKNMKKEKAWERKRKE